MEAQRFYTVDYFHSARCIWPYCKRLADAAVVTDDMQRRNYCKEHLGEALAKTFSAFQPITGMLDFLVAIYEEWERTGKLLGVDVYRAKGEDNAS